MKTVVYVHWGKSGAGPRFMSELLRASLDSGKAVSAVFNQCAEIDPFVINRLDHGIAVKTYRTVFGALLRFPLSFIASLRIRNELRQMDNLVVISVMENLHQSLLANIWLPRNAHYVSIIHDAQHHLGESSFVMKAVRLSELRRADTLVALSNDGLETLHRVTSKKVVLGFHPVWTSKRRENRKALNLGRPLHIGFFGRLVPYKGIELLPHVHKRLSQIIEDPIISIHGNGPLAPLISTYESIQKDLRWIPEDEIEQIFDTFDVVIIPYTEASQSGVIAQAAASGVPYVVTPVGGLIEQSKATGGGIIADGVTAEAIVEAISRLALDPDLYKEKITELSIYRNSGNTWDSLNTILINS